MVSDRMRRQLDRFLDDAEEAANANDWALVADKARAVLALEPDNADAQGFLAMAEANLGTPPALTSESASRSPAAQPLALTESFAGGRYRVVRFLGEGGKKKVYLAHDALLDRDVAFALIKSEGLDATARERVLREARAMGRLTHPHVVGIYDAGEADGAPYLVQELMAGGDVEGLLKAGTPTLARTLELAIGVCRGLEYAHAQGIVHRDLKPGNVWLSADGTPKLGDLGLAVSLDDTRLTTHGMMVGTYQYMPPEQALGQNVDARADLYSLGCMLYELVTGRTPFPGDTPTAVISQHLNAAPVAPSWHSEHCPSALETLILRLLAKRPEERPANAAEVRAVLEMIDPDGKSPPRNNSNANPLEALARGVFVGRERELEQLHMALDRAFQGRGSVVMLVGEPGIGKTRTVQELETYARMRGAEVYWGRTHESAGMPAYWPWLQVGRAWGQGRDVTLAAAQGAFGSGELVRLFPELANVPLMPAPTEDIDPESAQFRLFDAYAQFARGQATERSWVVVLDDLHWADKPTLQLLQYLARELANARILIVGTYRDTELSRTHPLSEALAELNRSPDFQRLVLRGLSRVEVGAYIRQQSAVEAAPALVDRVYEETEGNPFFLAEVVNLLAQEGTLDSGSVSDIALPDGVREALGRRLDRLSPQANALLGVAAIVGREFAYETLNLLEQHEPDELLRLIEEALAARVIEEAGQAGRYRFTHALMQETLLDELSATRRVRLHGQVAEALERRYGARADEYATILGLHYAESASLTPQHVVMAVHYLVAAGRQAESNAAWAEATRLYERAVTLRSTSDTAGFDDDEAELHWALGRCARFAAEYRTAWRNLMLALDAFKRRADGLSAARVTLDALRVNAPPGRQLALAREALELVEGQDSPEEARLMARLAQVDGIQDSVDEATRDHYMRRARALSQLLGLRDVEGELDHAEAHELDWSGRYAESVARLRSMASQVEQLGLVPEIVRYRFLIARVLLYDGKLDEAIAASEEAVAVGRRVGDQFSLQNSAFLLTIGLYMRCSFGRLGEVLEEMRDDYYWRWLVQARHDEVIGRADEAVASLPPPAFAGGVADFLTHVHGGRARVLLNAGQPGPAEAELLELENAFGTLAQHTSAPDVTGLGEADEALTRLGSDAFVALAYNALARANKHDVRQARLVGMTGLDRLRGDLALRLGLVEEAEQHFRTGLEWCEREDCPIEAGRNRQGLAEVAERRRDVEGSRLHLDAAGELFARHGAKLYLDQVLAKKQLLGA